MKLDLLKSKTGRTLVNHVILSRAKNPCCGGRDSSLALRATHFVMLSETKHPSYGGRDPSVVKSTLPQGDMMEVNS